MRADRVFKNSRVYSVALDGTETRAEAVAIKDGKFVYVGSDAGVEEYIGEGTDVTDCNGGSVLPGFGDAHMHFGISVRRFGVIDLNDLVTDVNTQTPDDLIKIMQERIKAFADSHPNDAVIHGSGWERTLFQGALGGITRMPTRHDIDAVVSDRPVALDSACGHMLLLNTKALEVAGITKDTPDLQTGTIHREPDGTPNGLIQESSAILYVCGRIPGFDYTEEQNRQAMLDAQKFFASRGITYVCDLLRVDLPYKVIYKMAKDGELKLRIDGSFNCRDKTMESDIEQAIAEKGSLDVDDIFKVDIAKYFIDESFGMMEPYTDEFCDAQGLPRGSRGEFLWDLDRFTESMKRVKKAGFNIHVHSYGDRAAAETINSMIASHEFDPEGKYRDAIAHIFFIKEEDVKRMAENNIIASIQPQWESVNIVDGKPIEDMVGAERFKTLYPNGSLARAGVRCAYGSDFTVTVTDPLEGITNALTRKYAKSNKYYESFKNLPAINESEATTLKDAIMGWTINVAYQFGREDLTGSIETGKSAEMVVLNGDIENTPAEDICLLEIKETLFKGETTYKA